MHIKRRNDSKEIQRMEKRGGEMLSIDQVNNLEAENKKLKQALKGIKLILETILRVDGASFDEALINEFDLMLNKIKEVLPA